MTVKMENFPAKNPNPVLSVAYDGTVLYSNKAGEPLLHGLGHGYWRKTACITLETSCKK